MIKSLNLIALSAGLLIACGSTAATSTNPAPANTAGPTVGAFLDWEAQLTDGKAFSLSDDDGMPVTATITGVQVNGESRTYTIVWRGNDSGPVSLTVMGNQVLVGSATMAEMKPAYEADGMICYGEDFSNPDGCDDVCDADICLSADAGIVQVDGLYAPQFGTAKAH